MKLFFTPPGLKRANEKEKQLASEVTAAGAKIGEAAGMNCDWHDNAGFDEARREFENLSTRLAEMRGVIAEAVQLTLHEQDLSVRIGNTVKVTLTNDNGDEEEKEFTIGAYGETDIKAGLIAYNSPMAAALMGHKEGDILEGIKIGNKTVDISIDEISPPSARYTELMQTFYKSEE